MRRSSRQRRQRLRRFCRVPALKDYVKDRLQAYWSPEQIAGVTIHYANRIEDVLAIALPKTQHEAVKDEEVREELLSAS